MIVRLLSAGGAVAALLLSMGSQRGTAGSSDPPQEPDPPQEVGGRDAPAYLGFPPPGLAPEVFAPDVLSLEDRYEYGCAVSRDGLEIHFGVAGEERAEIRFVRYADGEWSADEPVLPDAKVSFNDPFLSKDGDRLYFISDAATTGGERKRDHDIWFVERKEDGWSSPVHGGAPLNTAFEEYFVSLTDEGALYFASNRPIEGAAGEDGGFDLYAAPAAADSFGPPRRLSAAVNTEHYEADVFVAPDASYLIFCATRPDGLGRGDLYISFRQPDGEWSTARSMGDAINTEGHELCPFVTRDGKYFFYTCNEDIYWVDAELLESYR